MRNKNPVLKSAAKALFSTLIAVGSASGSIISVPITGTCGFTDDTGIVYSENFSGNGTFCAGVFAGGSVEINGALAVGDQQFFALARNTMSAIPPAANFDSVFVNFSTTYSDTEEYLVTSPVNLMASTTVYLGNLLSPYGYGDGSGFPSGHCSQFATITVNGASGLGSSPIPVTLDQPVTVVETVNATCNITGSIQGFGWDGYFQISPTPAELFDSHGNFLSYAVLTPISSTPEPPTTLPLFLIACFALPHLLRRRTA